VDIKDLARQLELSRKTPENLEAVRLMAERFSAISSNPAMESLARLNREFSSRFNNPAIEGLAHLNASLSGLGRNPAMEAMARFNETLANFPPNPMISEMARFNETLANFPPNPMIAEMARSEFRSPFQDIANNYALFESAFQRASKQLEIFNAGRIASSFKFNIAGIPPTIEALSLISENSRISFSSLATSIASLDIDGHLGNRLLQDLQINEKSVSNDTDGLIESINQIEEKAYDGIRVLGHLKRNAFNYITVLLAIYIAIDSSNSSKKMEDRLTARILESKISIVDQFHSEIGALRISDKKFVICRDVNLRSKPSSKGIILRVLYPNTLVDIVDKRNEWALIRAFNYVDGLVIEGWIDQKYLTDGRQQ
jgi:hypothetical protein